MLKTYFKIAWRNFSKNKVFSFINIIGLSVGLTCCMLITLYIINELSYDKYQKKADDIYQLGTVFIMQGKRDISPHTPAPMGAAVQHDFPEVVQQGRLASLFGEDKTLLQYKNNSSGEIKSFYEPHGYLADSTFFRIFTYNFKEGNPNAALANPRTIVLSEDIAKKLFGDAPALNKMVHVSSSSNGDNDYQVTGVFRPINQPSHIDGNFFMSMQGGRVDETMIKTAGTNMANNNMFYTYLQVKHGSNIKNMEARFPAFVDKYAGKDLKAQGFSKEQFLTNLKDIHLNSGIDKNVTAPGSLTYLYILASIALFTLLIACINFMNLATARSSKRSAEVGIRKVLGAEKGSLIRQFLGESILMSAAAFIIALTLTWLLIPAFNELSGKNLTLTFSDNLGVILSFFGLAIITGFMAGSYPAFYLSSFMPVKVLKGRYSNSFAAAWLRKGLVVFQFVISVVLIIASVVISNQMSYLRSADLGFDKDRQIVVPLQSQNAKSAYLSMRGELAMQSQVQNVGASLYYPGISNPSDGLYYKAGESMNNVHDVQMDYVDYNYLKTMGIQPVAGRIFSQQFTSDTDNAIILNETAIKTIGFASPQKAIGQSVYSQFNNKVYSNKIVGVVKDFHFEDLHLPIKPYGFQLMMIRYNYMIIHAKPGDITQALASIKDVWHKYNPNEPFAYSFVDADFQKNYDKEIKVSAIVTYFTALAILISCLGLFGLATFSAEQRIKEIGVRKVLGASVTNIVSLLSKDFLKLVAIAVVIASPIAWYIMNQWLQNFAFKISISWLVFVITTFVAMLIAFATISFQAIRAAITNPVKNLRTE